MNLLEQTVDRKVYASTWLGFSACNNRVQSDVRCGMSWAYKTTYKPVLFTVAMGGYRMG